MNYQVCNCVCSHCCAVSQGVNGDPMRHILFI